MAGLRDLRDRVVLVTGASSGIGAQLARDAAARGARVALLARRVDRLVAVAAELGGAGRALAVAADVADRAQVDAAVARTLETFGRVDLLINAAGWARHRLFKDEPVDEIGRMMATNFFGTVHAIKAVLPAMRRQGQGWIMNVSSVAGRLAQPDEAAYSATKFAVTGLSEALVYELAPLGIHVLTVYPALVRTEMFTDDVLARMPDRVKREFLEPEPFARAVWRALARGRHEVTTPWYVHIAYALRALVPAVHRRTVRNIRMPILTDLTS